GAEGAPGKVLGGKVFVALVEVAGAAFSERPVVGLAEVEAIVPVVGEAVVHQVGGTPELRVIHALGAGALPAVAAPGPVSIRVIRQVLPEVVAGLAAVH